MADDVRVVASGGPNPRRGVRTGTVLAILAALAVGVLIGRLTDGGSNQDRSRPPAAQRDAVGPSRSLGGVPVGYAHTEDGAVAALLNYSVVLSRLVLASDAERSSALRAMGTSEFATALGKRLAEARAQADQTPVGSGLRRGAVTVYRGAPLGYRVVRYDSTQATIETWAFGVVANDAGVGPEMTFQTATSTMRWENGDWKLATTSSRPGPNPSVAGNASSAESFVQLLSRLKGLRYAP